MGAFRRALPRLIAALLVGLIGLLWQRTRGADEATASTSRIPPAATPAAAATPPVTAGAAAATTPAARPAIGFKSRQRLVEHFEKHGREFPGYTMAQYLAAAQALRDRPAGGAVLEAVRSDGVITRFDRESGAFLATERSGHIRTYFRPNDGEAYFRRQLRRRPESGR